MSDEIKLKHFVLDEVKEVEGEDQVLHFVLSTQAVDRDQDTIAVDGWKLDNYKKNPVVLFGHDYKSLPVAQSLAIWTEDGALHSLAKFPSKELYPFGNTVYQFYKNKLLRAVSVGFKPVKWEYSTARKGGIDFLEQELLEYSCVPVPSNPEALARAKALDIDTLPLEEWAQEHKSGRVLSAANEDRLRQAVGLLSEVLAQLDDVAEEVDEARGVTEDEFITTADAEVLREELIKMLGGGTK